MVKFIFWGIFVFLCSSCHNAGVERGVELCEQMYGCRYNNKQIDSLAGLSVGLAPAERYAVLFHALQYRLGILRIERIQQSPLNLSDDERGMRYLQQLDSLKFPQVRDKATGFLLLDCYIAVNHEIKIFAPQLFDTKWIASLLFDMENRWRLTPQERLRFLVRKSEIYFGVFKEYQSAILIVRDGISLARKCGADQQTIMRLFRVSYQSLLQLEEYERLSALGDDFMELAEECQLDSLSKENIYHSFGMLCEQQGDYHKAYDLLSRTRKMRSNIYNSMFTRVYVGIDSIPVALAYIERCCKNDPHPILLANMLWDEACIRKKMGDDARYECCLRESVEISDRFPKYKEGNACASSEEYARILWQQGRCSEAIRRLELVNRKLTQEDYANPSMARFYDSSLVINRCRLLINYYEQVGRTGDALRQSLLCDSLERQLAKARLQREREKTVMMTFANDLLRNVEFRAIQLKHERQKLYFTYFILGVTFLTGAMFFVLYCQHKRQLNVLYARQKEIEQLQAEKRRLAYAKVENISPEEQLFRNLEHQFYKEELFRNPGFSRDDFCRLGGTNRMYVSTCINKYAGTNINQWINKARIDYAIRLIGEGETDLTRLSELSGFSSIKSFFRSFKQFTNLSPRQYIVRDRQPKE